MTCHLIGQKLIDMKREENSHKLINESQNSEHPFLEDSITDLQKSKKLSKELFMTLFYFKGTSIIKKIEKIKDFN